MTIYSELIYRYWSNYSRSISMVLEALLSEGNCYHAVMILFVTDCQVLLCYVLTLTLSDCYLVSLAQLMFLHRLSSFIRTLWGWCRLYLSHDIIVPWFSHFSLRALCSCSILGFTFLFSFPHCQLWMY